MGVAFGHAALNVMLHCSKTGGGVATVSCKKYGWGRAVHNLSSGDWRGCGQPDPTHILQDTVATPPPVLEPNPNIL